MNNRAGVRSFQILFVLSLLYSLVASAAPSSVEFEKLRAAASEWKRTADVRTLNELNEGAKRLTECPEETYKVETTRLLEIFGTSYEFYSIARPNGQICLFMVEPFRRPLSLDEAKDLQVALAMPPANAESEKKNESPEEGERRFKQLIDKAEILGDPDQVAARLEKRSYEDCSHVPEVELRASPGGQATGYIYNGAYSWKEVQGSTGVCVYVDFPLHRGLTVDEARLFVRATQIPFYDRPSSSLLKNDSDVQGLKMDVRVEDINSIAALTAITAADSGLRKITSSSFPYNGIGLVVDSENKPGSAVQVGDYVFVTAAHVVLDASGNTLPGLRLYPAYRLPGSTNTGQVFTVVPDPDWRSAADTNHKRAHDLAFLRVNQPRLLPFIIRPFLIQSTVDVGISSPYPICIIPGNGDPYAINNGTGRLNTWFDDYSACSAYPYENGTVKLTAGYPAYNGTVNNSVHDPYSANPVSLKGNLFLGKYRELFHACDGCSPVIGMANSHVSPGFSGGAFFGLDPYATSTSTQGWSLVGVITDQALSNSIGIDGLAAGDFDYHHSWFLQNLSWRPAPNPITITSPAEGGTYTSANVPNLIANAGAQTSQLQWKSNINGVLGTGGNVSVAGRLSPGSHTITASIESAAKNESEVLASTVYNTVHITVTGSTTPTFRISPSRVPIPTYKTTGSFTYTWSATAYPSLDLVGVINNGTPLAPFNIPNAGSVTENITLGTTYEYRFYPHGSTTPLLGTLSVSGVAAPAPTFAANPAHIVTNGASGNTTITWSAPGYGQIDWCGKVNSSAWTCGQVITPDTGSTVQPVPVGTTYSYRFYPHGSANQGGTFQLLGELTVDAVASGTPTFTANPTHVIVPAGGTSGNSIITWNAPGYTGLDWCGKVNGGAWAYGVSTGPVGKTVQPIPVGSTYGYRFYPSGQYGSCTTANLLGELTINASY